ncbi:ferredoxin [Streptomyces sp. NPDC017638]
MEVSVDRSRCYGSAECAHRAAAEACPSQAIAPVERAEVSGERDATRVRE